MEKLIQLSAEWNEATGKITVLTDFISFHANFSL